MTDRSVKVRLGAETAPYIRGMQESYAATDRLVNRLDALDRAVRRVDGRTVRIGADSTAVQRELERLERSTTRMSVRIDGRFDERQLQSQLDRMRLHVRVRPDVDRIGPLPPVGGGGSSRGGGIGLGGLGGLGGGLAAGVGLAVALLPQAVSLLSAAGGAATAFAGQLGLAGAAAGGIVPILGSVGQAAGALAIGTIGVGDAFKAYTASQKAAATAAPRAGGAMASAAEAIETAERGVARARQASADSAEDNARRVKDARRGVAEAEMQAALGVESALDRYRQAELGVADAQRDATDAVDDLRDARRGAQDDLEDLASRAARGTLDERAAVLDLTEARRRLGEATRGAAVDATTLSQAEVARRLAAGWTSDPTDGSESIYPPAVAADAARARLDVDRATLALADQRRENQRVREEQKQAAKDGINGSDRVRTAQERLTAAVQAEAQARRDVGVAAQGIDRARSQGAQAVADAQRRVSDAVRVSARAQRDSAQRIADAQRSVANASRAAGEAQAAASDTGSTAARTYEAALADLSDNQRKFVLAVLAQEDAFGRLRNAVGDSLFAGLDRDVRMVSERLLPLLQTELTDTASIANQTGRGLIRDLAGPLRGDVAGALRLNNDLLLAGSPIAGKLTGAFLSLYNATGPLAMRLVDAAVGAADLADSAAQAGQESGRLEAFFERAGDRAFTLGRIVGDVGGALGNTFKIGNEGSGTMLSRLEGLTSRWETWTDSIEGRDSLRRWFDEGREAASSFGSLIGDVRREFEGLTDNADASDTIDGLRRMVPYLADFVKTLSGSGETGRQFGRALLDIADALDKANAVGGLVAFTETVAALLKTLSDVVQGVPGGTQALGTLVVAIGTLKAAQFVLGPLVRLAGGLRGLFAAATGASAASLALGGLGAALAIAAIAYGSYRNETRGITDDVGRLNAAVGTGSITAILQADEAFDAATAKRKAFYEEWKDRSLLGRLFTPGDNLKAVAVADSIDTMSVAGDQADLAIQRLRGSLATYITNSTDLTREQRYALVGDYAAMTAAVDQWVIIAEQAGVIVGDSHITVTRLLNAHTEAQRRGGLGALDMAESFAVLGDSASTAGARTDAFRRILEGYDEGAQSAREATIRFEAAIDAVTESVKINGKGLDLNTAAGRANQQALSDAKTALNEQIARLVAAKRPQAEVNEAIRKGSERLRDQTKAAGGTAAQQRDLNKVLGLTPRQIEILIREKGGAEVLARARDLEVAVRRLAKLPGMTWAMANTEAQRDRAMENRRPAGKAGGGLLYGPGTGTSDSILGIDTLGRAVARVSAGEFVHRERAVDKYGVPFMHAVNAGRFPVELARGYAGGGTITGGVQFTLDPARFGRAYGDALDALRERAAQLEPSQGGSATGLLPVMAAARRYTMDTYGITNIGGYANRNIAGTNTLSDHARGKAIDVMTSQLGLGWEIARDFAFGRANRLFNIENTIWQQSISSRGGPFRAMADRGSPTQNHREHIHADTYAHGGRIRRAHAGGYVTSTWPTMPGLATDERPAVLQVGERVQSRQEVVRAPQGVSWGRAATVSAPAVAVKMPDTLVLLDLDGQLIGRMRVEARAEVEVASDELTTAVHYA